MPVSAVSPTELATPNKPSVADSFGCTSTVTVREAGAR
jgi:hypothetical protein